MWELSKGSYSKYSKEFSWAHAEIHESIWARISGTKAVWIMVENPIRSSIIETLKRKFKCSNLKIKIMI